MSEPYQIAALQPEGLPPEDAVPRVHRLLETWSIGVADDSLLALHDAAEKEPEVEPANAPMAALSRIMTWPTLGTLDYAGPEGIVTVSYLGEAGRGVGLQAVLISAQERAVERTDSISRYQAIGSALHEQLPAQRTVMQWGLEMHGFRWHDEVERLRQGLFEGLYPLLDLRRLAS